MALDRRPDIAGQEAGREKDGAARQMIADAEVRVFGSPAKMQDDGGEGEEFDRGDRSRERRKRKIKPQGRENDKEKIEERRPRPKNDGGREISGEEIEQHCRKACFNERIHVAPEDRKISTATEEDREQAGGEQFVGDEGGERRQPCVHREPLAINRPHEAGSERRRQEDQDENESLQEGQDQHAPPLADENLAVQEALKGRGGVVWRFVHLDPFGAPMKSEADRAIEGSALAPPLRKPSPASYFPLGSALLASFRQGGP